ncbi:MAG: MBL fold metallo-hydrolase [Rhodospirillales bacterium]
MRITILGCGSSSGVPAVGNFWGGCDPDDPRNRRLRSSILIEVSGKSLLVDTSPDLREQLLRVNHSRLDAVLFTHAHADHVHGIDELRWVNMATDQWIDVYSDQVTLDEIGRRFGYVFEAQFRDRPFYKPCLTAHCIGPGEFDVAGLTVTAFDQDHGYSGTLGFRIGNFAYSTDCVRLDDRAFDCLKGVDTWVVDCFRMKEHSTHSWFSQTLEWIDRVRPGRAVLTHMGPDMDYQAVADLCPEGVEPARDGMVIEI